jgi:hypothetical protein
VTGLAVSIAVAEFVAGRMIGGLFLAKHVAAYTATEADR